MHTRVFIYVLVGLTVASAACAAKAPDWLATGTVTKVDGNTIYFLSKDNVVFRIDAGGAVIVSDVRLADGNVRPGDKIRVFGYSGWVEPCQSRADQDADNGRLS